MRRHSASQRRGDLARLTLSVLAASSNASMTFLTVVIAQKDAGLSVPSVVLGLPRMRLYHDQAAGRRSSSATWTRLA